MVQPSSRKSSSLDGDRLLADDHPDGAAEAHHAAHLHTWSEAPPHSPNYLVPDQVPGRRMAHFKRGRNGGPCQGCGLDHDR